MRVSVVSGAAQAAALRGRGYQRPAMPNVRHESAGVLSQPTVLVMVSVADGDAPGCTSVQSVTHTRSH